MLVPTPSRIGPRGSEVHGGGLRFASSFGQEALRSGAGQFHQKARPTPLPVAFRPGSATHGIGQGANDGEPNPGTPEGAAAGRVNAVEALEHDLELVWCQASPLVSDDHNGFRSVQPRRDRY